MEEHIASEVMLLDLYVGKSERPPTFVETHGIPDDIDSSADMDVPSIYCEGTIDIDALFNREGTSLWFIGPLKKIFLLRRFPDTSRHAL